MTLEPIQDPASDLFSLPDTAARLDVPETTVREWLTTFNWERRYDGEGHLYLTRRDLEFLRVIKSLKDVDRSCESIVRILEQDEEPAALLKEASEAPGSAAEGLRAESSEAPVIEAEPPVEVTLVVEAAPEPDVETGLEQIETLKAELRELHAQAPQKKPFWKFW